MISRKDDIVFAFSSRGPCLPNFASLKDKEEKLKKGKKERGKEREEKGKKAVKSIVSVF